MMILTSPAKKNCGIMLKGESSTGSTYFVNIYPDKPKLHNENGGSRYVKFYSAHFTGVSQTLLPTVSITYVDQAGLEGYLSYHSAGSGTMGTVSVSDATGNLIYAYDDISLSGEYMPLSIQHVYDHAKRTSTDLAGSAMHYGAGFRLNLSQKIESTTISGYPYKYIDADGTAHLFKLKNVACVVFREPAFHPEIIGDFLLVALAAYHGVYLVESFG